MKFDKFKTIFKNPIHNFFKNKKIKAEDKRLFNLASSSFFEIIENKNFFIKYIQHNNANVNTFFKTSNSSIIETLKSKNRDNMHEIKYHNSFMMLLEIIGDDRHPFEIRRENSQQSIDFLNSLIINFISQVDFSAKIPKTQITIKDYVEYKLKNPLFQNNSIGKTLATALLNFNLNNSLMHSATNSLENKTHKPTKI